MAALIRQFRDVDGKARAIDAAAEEAAPDDDVNEGDEFSRGPSKL